MRYLYAASIAVPLTVAITFHFELGFAMAALVGWSIGSLVGLFVCVATTQMDQ